MTDLILIPTYNERENILAIVPEIFEIMPDVRIAVVDDNSPDGTADAVKLLQLKYSNLSLMSRPEKNGLGNAYKAAMLESIGDESIRSIITMDADGSHQSKYLKDFLANIDNFDVIIGARYVVDGGVENWELWRRALSRFGNFYARTLTGLHAHDLTAGFMCIRREVLAQVDFASLDANGYSYLIELKFNLLNKLHGRLLEVPIIFKLRREGESKLSQAIILEGLKTPFRLFTYRFHPKPSRLCPLCGQTQALYWFQKNSVNLYRCRACNSVFSFPIPAGLIGIYDDNYFFKSSLSKKNNDAGYVDYDADKEPMKAEFLKALRDFSVRIPGRRIFDVGAATGYFLDLARAEGWQTAGIEISDFAVQAALKRGHQVVSGDFAVYRSTDKADVVTLWDVLEHVKNPPAYLAAAADLLVPGGLLAINTVNITSCWARLLGRRWQLIVPPEHLFYFSSRQLQLLIATAGFKIIKIGRIRKNFSLSYICRILYGWQKFALWLKLAECCDRGWWRKVSLPIDLRDNIYIIAEKI